MIKLNELVEIRTLIDEMTGNSFLSEIAEASHITFPNVVSFIPNNLLSDILTDIENTTIYEKTCTTVYETHTNSSVNNSFDSFDSCPSDFSSHDGSDFGSHESCSTDFGSHDGSHDSSADGTFCCKQVFGFSIKSPTFNGSGWSTENGNHCGSGFTENGRAISSLMMLSLDDENGNDSGEGGLDESNLLRASARATNFSFRCRIVFSSNEDLMYQSGFNSSHCVGGFCSSFDAASYFDTL